MILKPLLTQAIPASTTGTVKVQSGKIAPMVNADGTNAASLTLRKNGSGGDIIYSYAGVNPPPLVGPIECGGENAVVYYATGANTTAFLYECVLR